MKKFYKSLVCLLCLVTSFTVSAQKWDENFLGASGSGFKGRAVIEFGGELYVGGTWNAFFQSFIMKWDGTDWSAVGTGFVENTDFSAGIYALEVFNGELYAAGTFSISISSTNYVGVVKWNGTAWQPIADFPSFGSVYDLVEFNGNLMMGGTFSGLFGGSTGIQNIIGHNGTNWVLFDEGVRSGEVSTMDVHGGQLYIAGQFDNDVATNASLDNIAVWDGVNQEWDNVDAFATLYTNAGYIDKIKSYGSDLYVFTIRDDIFNSNPRLVKWDLASTLTVINTVSVTPEFSTLSFLNDMIVYDGNLVVSGTFRDSSFGGNNSPVQIETYDGTTWNKELPGGASADGLGIFAGELTTGELVLNDPSATIVADKTIVCEDEPIAFSFIEVASNSITSVNWTFEGGTPATSTDLSPVVTYTNGGEFDVTLEVTSSDGTNEVIEQNLIFVNNDLAITNQPVDASICDNENAVFSVVASGAGVPITYQWQMDDNSGAGFVDLGDGVVLGVSGASNINGSKSTTMTISGNGLSQNDLNGNKFRCVVTKCTTINSDEVVLTVTEAPVITKDANFTAVCESGDATISVEATSAGALSYQWQYRVAGTNTYADLSDAGAYSGTTTASLDITGADNSLPELFDSDNSDGLINAQFRCVISANGCEVISGLGLLTIHGVPSITEDPMDVTVCNTGQGVTTSFSVNSSLGSLIGVNYQWQVDDGMGFVDLSDDAVYSGVNSNTLDLTSAPSSLDGYQYRCEVGGCSSPVYSAGATLTIDDAPVITQQPVTTSVCEGSDAVITVEATGDNLSYQWQERIGSAFIDLTNNATYFASDNQLTITSSLSLHNRQFRCVITSASCDINSSIFQLRVYETPSFSFSNQDVADETACDDGNSTVMFDGPFVNDFNTAVHTYQWQEAFGSTGIFVDISDDDKFSGTDTRFLSITNPTVSMDGNQYRLKINGCVTDVISGPGTLTVKRLPIITASPDPQMVCFGEPISFSVTAVGDDDMTYDWQVSTDGGTTFGGLSGFTGQGTTNISSTGVFNTSMDGWLFKCVVSAATPCTTLTAESFEALLTINEVDITTQPTQQIICENETAVFSLVAEGQSLTYQWLENGSPIADGGVYSGATSNTLTITGATSALNGNQYSCTVTGLCDPETSFSTSLSVTSVAKPELVADLTNSNGPTLSISNVFGDSYEWRLDGTTLNEFGSSIVMTTEGSYTVLVTSNNCVSEESDAYEFSGSALGFDDEDYITIYPNPAQEFLEVGVDGVFTIQMYSLDGRAVLSGSISKNQPLDLSSLNSGQYMIRLYERELLIHTSKILKTN